MANFEVSETYNNEIKKLEPTTPGHADNFNEIFQKLINNDAFIKKVAEQQLAIMQSHISNADDPHQEVFQTYYQQLVSYTDKAVADLINGAPETADTLRELADLIDKNKDVATALNEAIGKKANQTELDQAVSDISSLNRTFTQRISELNTNLTTHKTSGDHDSAYVARDGAVSKLALNRDVAGRPMLTVVINGLNYAIPISGVIDSAGWIESIGMVWRNNKRQLCICWRQDGSEYTNYLNVDE